MPGYKAKTIKAILTKKIDKWAATIEDEALRKMVQKNTIVTGGCITSMLLGEDVNDFDIYFRDYETTLAVAQYYVEAFKKAHPKDFRLFIDPDYNHGEELSDAQRTDATRQKWVRLVAKSDGIAGEETETGEYKYFETEPDGAATEYISKVMDNPDDIEDTHEDTKLELQKNPQEGKFRPVFLSSNAITLSDKIQIVIRFYGEPDEIHQNYDYVHCTSYWQSWDGNLVLRPEALESILSKELRYVGSKYPICSIIRLRKFIARGWRINAGQILKMCMQIGELDLTDIKVLDEQLTGVDTAYFFQLISRLKENDPEKVDSAYLVEIIDRMF